MELPPLRTAGRHARLWAIAAILAALGALPGVVHARAVGAVTHLGVMAPATSTAGVAFTITVTAYDMNTAVVTGYTGTVHIVAADAQATVPSDYSFQTADQGRHTFTNGVILRTAGTDPITVSDTSNTTVTGSTNVDVSTSTPHSFLFTATVASTSPAATFGVEAAALDAYGNTVTTYAGTVHFTSSDVLASLPADYTFTGTENGFHFFPDSVTLRTVGTQTVIITDKGNSAVTGHTSVVVYPPCPMSPTRAILAAQFAGRPSIGLNDELAIATNGGVCVMSESVNPPQLWSPVPFYGTRATLAADVNGDGLVDLVAVNDTSTWVMLSNGHGFSPPVKWSDVPFYGSRATLAADITGTGRASLIAVDDTDTWVMLSSGASPFSQPTPWSNVPFYGSRGTFASDVQMMGKAALVAVDNSGVWVMTSSGKGFTAPTIWSPVPFYGSVATLASADGREELIAVNGTGQWIMISNGSAFTEPTLASQTPFYGTQATLPALVQGGTSVLDLLAVDASSIWLEQSSGVTFRSPMLWASSVP